VDRRAAKMRLRNRPHDAQNAFIRDEDGTFLGGDGGAILARAEVFSSNSFFGIPYSDPINSPPDVPFWYPNLPAVMRSDRYTYNPLPGNISLP
jgi:hypothetical protein